MNRWKPNGSTAIVTGASSGIGWHLCLLLASRGCKVLAAARRTDRLSELARSADNDMVFPVKCDVTSSDDRRDLVSRASDIGDGRLDLLVNNAGAGAIGQFSEATPDRLRTLMEVNFFAPVELTRQSLTLLRNGRAPVICNIGSVLGHRAVANKSEYCASKFALHGFSDSLRAELATDNVQVTLVSPSTTRSEFFDKLIDTNADETSKSLGSWPPEKVARSTLAAIAARRSEVILSLGGKALVYADRLAPPLMNKILAKGQSN